MDRAISEHDWPEDFIHENGNYQNKCCHCKTLFIGHKRRQSCKKCSEDGMSKYTGPIVNVGTKGHIDHGGNGMSEDVIKAFDSIYEHLNANWSDVCPMLQDIAKRLRDQLEKERENLRLCKVKLLGHKPKGARR